MKHILQFSDIHLGADYGGHLDTQGQWKAVVQHAKETCPNGIDGYDAIVITGDLVDDTSLVDPDNNCSSWDHELSETEKYTLYMQILVDARRLLGVNGKLIVTPGNHDNRQLLGKAAVEAGVVGATEDMFMKPGKCLQFASLGHNIIVTMDTGNGEPYEAISELAYYVNKDRGWNRERALLFTHKPFKTPNLYHRFMKDNMLDASLSHHMMQYVRYYFCGHLHHFVPLEGLIDKDNFRFCMNVCPGVQCQIDPYSEKCNAVQLPGYVKIACHDITAEVDIQSIFLENWKELASK